MKKITLLLSAAVALVAASCSQEVEESAAATTASSAIGFMTNTSRAEVLTLATLQGDDDGFVVYGTMASDAGAWNINMGGSNYYSYKNDYWEWTQTQPEWPDDDYPINFYAIYYADTTGVTVSADDEESLSLTYIAPSDSSQTDILTATAVADARPSGDKLPLTFNHLLSKIDVGITTSSDVTVHTQFVGFNELCNKREYLFAEEDWDDQDTDDTDDYIFMDTKNEAIDSSKDDIEGDDGELMLLPQTTTSWVPESGTEASGAHLSLIYRAATTADADLIGYTVASTHPDYDPDTDSQYVNTPLFVYVGYPLGSPSLVLESGKSYDYDINIATTGASNGYLLDDVYYDDEGKPTKFEIKGKEVGDPVSDGYIDFTVTVNSWVATTADTTLE